MKELNKELKFRTFKNLKVEDLYPHILSNDFACSIDLSKAYFHLPIHSKYQKFFSFQFNKVKYHWSSMPFGLSSAPYLFSKVMSEIVEFLRNNFNINIHFYLDDFIIFNNSKESTQKDSDECIKLFKNLGLSICYKKSVLEPVSSIVYLGTLINLQNKTIQLSEENIRKCIFKTNKILKGKNCIKSNFKVI